MKKLLGFILALPLVVLAAEEPSYYKAGEFNISAYGGVTTPDFTAERLSVGASVGYFLTRHLGVEVEGFAGDTDGVFVDQGAAQLVYRIPVGRSAPYLFAGAFYSFEDRAAADNANDEENWGVSLGLGLEHRFTPNIAAFGDARIEKFIESGDPQARARLGLRLVF